MEFKDSKAGRVTAIYRKIYIECPYCDTENKVYGGDDLDCTSPIADLCICKKCKRKFWIESEDMNNYFEEVRENKDIIFNLKDFISEEGR